MIRKYLILSPFKEVQKLSHLPSDHEIQVQSTLSKG